MKLTAAQAALCRRIQAAASKSIRASVTPGRESDPRRWFIAKPYSDEDGRVCEALVRRGVLVEDGGAYILRSDFQHST